MSEGILSGPGGASKPDGDGDWDFPAVGFDGFSSIADDPPRPQRPRRGKGFVRFSVPAWRDYGKQSHALACLWSIPEIRERGETQRDWASIAANGGMALRTFDRNLRSFACVLPEKLQIEGRKIVVNLEWFLPLFADDRLPLKRPPEEPKPATLVVEAIPGTILERVVDVIDAPGPTETPAPRCERLPPDAEPGYLDVAAAYLSERKLSPAELILWHYAIWKHANCESPSYFCKTEEEYRAYYRSRDKWSVAQVLGDTDRNWRLVAAKLEEKGLIGRCRARRGKYDSTYRPLNEPERGWTKWERTKAAEGTIGKSFPESVVEEVGEAGLSRFL